MIYVHLLALLFLFVVIVISDHKGFLWIRGKKQTLPLSEARILHLLVWVGLVVMMLSGAVMVWPLKDFLVHEPAFYVKVFFVLALVVNGLFIGRFMHVAAEKPFAELAQQDKMPILISAAVSTVSWVGAFIAALFMTTSNWILYFLSFIF